MECTTISCLHPADEIMLSVLFGAKTAIRKTWCHLPDFRFSGSPHNFRIASIYYCSSLSRISITAARCVAWRAIVSDSYRFNELRSALKRFNVKR